MPDEPSSESTRSGPSWTWWVLWLCFFLFVVYPLSTGPLFVLFQHTGADQSLLTTIYAPFVFLSDNFEPVADFFAWYVGDIWGLDDG